MNLSGKKHLKYALALAFALSCAPEGFAQGGDTRPSMVRGEESTGTPSSPAGARRLTPEERERLLLERIEALETRLAALETSKGEPSPSAANVAGVVAAPPVTEVAPGPQVSGNNPASDLLPGTSMNFFFDGYYGYNFNRPVGRVNLLRAYDVMSNSFSLNQTGLIVERAPDVEAGRRWGFRLDLMYGQATETVQGSAANEPRPQAFRPLWQAYGTYVVPVGRGLNVDFGKFASSLGYESNYTKDNFNYSRSYYFNFLPFYHFGFRARLPLNDKLSVMYHLMNGQQQSEDFNGFKSQHFAVIVTPHPRVSWQVNYYFGQEQRDLVPDLNPTLPTLPTQPGLSTTPITPTLRGRLHILDSYVTWNATDKLTLALEGDYVINRVQTNSAASVLFGGAVYAVYNFHPHFGLAARAEYLSDRNGLFSGTSQALKETTLTANFPVTDGFLVRAEWRRDFSNQPFFLTSQPSVLRKEQNTATVGMLWWFGRKQGSW
jgi:hypothetical protein